MSEVKKNTKDKAALVPRLRFQEFREAGGWIARTLKDICEVNPSNSGLPDTFAYIDLESVEAGKLKVRKIINCAEAPSRAQRLLRYGDVIFQIVRPYQRNNLLFKIDEKIPFVASTGYAQLRAITSEDFLFQAVHVDDFVERVIAKCTGSSYPAINSSDLADISLAVPSEAEQQKIADCLSSLDELIMAETKKLDALKTHKKGLMQQLFPQEGETVPRLRFPEFQGAEDWEESQLGNLVEIRSGYSPSQYQLGEDADYPFVKVEDLNNCTKYQETAREYSSATYGLIPRNSVIFPKRGAAIALNKIRLTLGELLMDTNMMALTPLAQCDVEFLFYYLLNIELSQIADNSTIPQINNKHIIPFRILIPSTEEQHRISNCLSTLDESISGQALKLDVIQAHKKGLMQQLFPVLDGVQA